MRKVIFRAIIISSIIVLAITAITNRLFIEDFEIRLVYNSIFLAILNSLSLNSNLKIIFYNIS